MRPIRAKRTSTFSPPTRCVDAAIAFRSSTDQWTAEAFITNALDEAVKTEAFYGTAADVLQLGPAPPGGLPPRVQVQVIGRSLVHSLAGDEGTSRLILHSGTAQGSAVPFL